MELIKLKQEKPYKWKIQSYSKDKTKVSCVAYMDSRYVQDLLDEVCEPQNWQSLFYEVKWKVFCKIGIKIWDDWIWKSDSWALEENENVETETTSKWETSDAFKRAAVQWWIGRFLYDKPIQWITKEEYETNKYKLTDFINDRLNWKNTTKPQIKDKDLELHKCRSCDDDVKVKVFEWQYWLCFKCPSCGKYSKPNKI